MSTLGSWLEHQYLEWQMRHGRISLAKWSDFLGVDKTYLNQLMNGRRASVTMQTAYQIGERLGDFSILEVLGYPVPDAPLIGLADDERAVVLGWLEYVKTQLDSVPEAERMATLKAILDGLPDADTKAD